MRTLDRDFSTVTFKVNTAGSWANLVTVPVERYDEAKEACSKLAEACCMRVKFKIVDQAGGELEYFGPDQTQGGICDWRKPARGLA